MNPFQRLFSENGFMPHGHCYFWDPTVLWLHIVSDALITLAYYSIPFTLLYFFYKRKDLVFGWMFLCFATFIVACGTTHLMEIWAIWHPTYYLTGSVKALTAIASVPTAILLIRLVPKALALPSGEQLKRINTALSREINERTQAEDTVRRLNEDLEKRIEERTAAFELSNRELRREILERERGEKRQESFFLLARELSAARDAAGAARVIAEATDTLFRWDAFSVDLYYAPENLIEPVLTMDTINGRRQEVPPAYEHAEPSAIAWRVINGGAQLILRDDDPSGGMLGAAPFGDTNRPSASLMFVPIRKGADILGVISVQSYRPKAYQPSDLELLQALADLCGGALERIRAETALRESEERYRSLVDATTSLVWTADAEGRFTTPQAAWGEFTGQSWEQHRGQGWTEALHPEDRAEIESRWKEAVRTGSLYESEGRIWHAPSGEHHYFVARGVPLKNADGSVREWIGTLTDIHDRRRAEEALSETQERFSSFMQNLPGVAFIKEESGRYLYVNPFWEGLFHKTLPDIVGQTDDELFDAETAAAFKDNDRTVFERGEPLQAIESVVIESERRHWIINKFMMTRHPSGQQLLGGIGIDVTERRQAEEEVQKLNTELELRVARRTAELATANKELEAFSYSVSHDLRAPLRSIDGFSQALEEDCGPALTDAGRKYLQRVRGSAQRMGQLIDDLLTLSRVTRHAIRRERMNLSHMGAAVIEELKQTEPGRPVRVEIEPDMAVQGDPRLLRVVLDNLLGNAWKFTRHQPEARIEFGAVEREGETVYFVRDNGCGFNMAYANKLFGAFQRLHSGTEFEGTGIGLATVQRIIHRHGGRVWAEAQVDLGATFYFTLPG